MTCLKKHLTYCMYLQNRTPPHLHNLLCLSNMLLDQANLYIVLGNFSKLCIFDKIKNLLFSVERTFQPLSRLRINCLYYFSLPSFLQSCNACPTAILAGLFSCRRTHFSQHFLRFIVTWMQNVWVTALYQTKQ